MGGCAQACGAGVNVTEGDDTTKRRMNARTTGRMNARTTGRKDARKNGRRRINTRRPTHRLPPPIELDTDLVEEFVEGLARLVDQTVVDVNAEQLGDLLVWEKLLELALANL